MVDEAAWTFMAERRTAILATLSSGGQPRLVPICFVLEALGGGLDAGQPTLYTPLDEKPKRSADVRHLARVRDISERPEVWLLFERWSEDWSRLAWLRAEGVATLLEPGQTGPHGRAVEALRVKYPQYRDQAIDALPLIGIGIIRTTAWSASSGGA